MEVESPLHPRCAIQRRSSCLFLLLGLTACGQVAAAASGQLASDYLVRTWQSDTGLPQNSVSAILQTQDGYLWIGTFNGLVRFDGLKFTSFTVGNTPELVSDSIVTLFQDRRRRLWVGTDGGGLACLEEGKFTCYTLPDRVGASVVSTISEDQQGGLWIGTDGGLYRLSAGRIAEVKADNATEGFGAVHRIYCDPEGTLWMSIADSSISDSLWTWRKGTLRREAEYAHISGMTSDMRSRVWLASSTKGLICPQGVNPSAQSLPHDKLPELICATRNGDIWLVKGLILTRLRAGQWKDYHLSEELLGGGLLVIFEDREQNLWIGTNGRGLLQLRPKVVQNYSVQDGLPGNDIVVLAEGLAGQVWIGGFGVGIGVWDKTNRYQRLAGLPKGREDVPAIWPGRNNRMWLGTRDGMFFSWETNGTVIRQPEVKDGARIIFEDRDGGLWLGTRSRGVELRQRGTITRFSQSEGLSDNFVTGIAQTPDGAIWIGTKHGLNRWLDGRISQFDRRDGLGAECIHTLYIDTAGILWAGTAGGGLARFKDGKFGAVTASHGLPNEVVAQIIEDGMGFLWIGSNAGIFRANRQELLECADGKRSNARFQSFGRNAGLLNPECAGSFQPSCLRSGDGKLWFATVGGIVVIDPTQLILNSLPPPVHVTSITADGKQCRLSAGTAESAAEVTVPQGRSKVQIDFTGLGFAAPEAVHFRFRLAGVDTDWVEARTGRTAYYNRLSPGSYTFEVTACNEDGVWNETGATVALQVMPFWWQTSWFKSVALLAMASALTGTIWALHNRRLRRALEKAQQKAAQDFAQELAAVNSTLRAQKLALETALANVKTLNGLIPICSHCKKVRSDEGYWQQVEAYVQQHSEAQFSHGLCPDCLPIFFPDAPGQG